MRLRGFGHDHISDFFDVNGEKKKKRERDLRAISQRENCLDSNTQMSCRKVMGCGVSMNDGGIGG